jgi:predicted membrane metal-binding protein
LKDDKQEYLVTNALIDEIKNETEWEWTSRWRNTVLLNIYQLSSGDVAAFTSASLTEVIQFEWSAVKCVYKVQIIRVVV